MFVHVISFMCHSLLGWLPLGLCSFACIYKIKKMFVSGCTSKTMCNVVSFCFFVFGEVGLFGCVLLFCFVISITKSAICNVIHTFLVCTTRKSHTKNNVSMFILVVLILCKNYKRINLWNPRPSISCETHLLTPLMLLFLCKNSVFHK